MRTPFLVSASLVSFGDTRGKLAIGTSLLRPRSSELLDAGLGLLSSVSVKVLDSDETDEFSGVIIRVPPLSPAGVFCIEDAGAMDDGVEELFIDECTI